MAVTELSGAGQDVCTHPEGWAMVYIDDFDVHVTVNGVERWVYTVVPGVDIDNGPIFPHIACDPAGVIKVSCSMSHVDNSDWAYLIEEGAQTDLGIRVRTQRGTLIAYEGGDFVVYITDTPLTYIRYPLAGVPSAPINTPFVPLNNPMGFLDVLDGVITWATNEQAHGYNTIVLGGVLFYLPITRAGVTVGQAKGEPVTDEAIIAWTGNAVQTVIPGKGFEPHLAQITTGPDAGHYVFSASMLGHVVSYSLVPLTGFNVGGAGLLTATIPPVSHPVEENGQGARNTNVGPPPLLAGSTRMTLPWQGWAQAVRRALTGLGQAVIGLQQAVGDAFSFGNIAVEGDDTVGATEPSDTVTLESSDGSVAITSNPVDKSIDFAVAGGGAMAAEFLVAAPAAGLPNERVVQDSPTVTWDFTVPGVAKANSVGGGGYVPVSTGAEPLEIMSNGAGEVLLVPYTP